MNRSVVLISHTYPPVLGGSEIEAQRIMAELIRRGYRVLVLCAGGGPMPKPGPWIDSAGVPVRILTNKSEGTFVAIQFTLRVAWKLLLHRSRIGMAYFLMPGLHLTLGLPVARLLRMKTIMKFSGSNTIRPLAKSRAGRFELSCLRRWSVPVMLLNDAMVDEAESVGLRRSQTLFMPNPVDVSLFSPATAEEKLKRREEFGIRDDSFVVIYTGRLSEEKGLRYLIEGVLRAMETETGIQLLLIGDGPYRAELEALAASGGGAADRIRFVGRVAPDSIPIWLSVADIFALVSPHEGFSCALAEAMAVGLPSLVSDIPANAQLVRDGVHGLTVPVGDTEAIALALRKLKASDEVRRSMASSAREEIVQNYSLDKVVDRYEALFAEIQ